MIWDELDNKLADLEAKHLRRQRRIVSSPTGPRIKVDGRELLSFCSNDYLGLAHHPDIVSALQQGAAEWGAGSGASHLVGGHLQPHEALEQALADFLGFPSVLTFSTGYMANLAVTPALVGRGDAVFADKLNHASLIDAALASRAEHHRYPHNDMAALERLLAASTAQRKLILTDAVFSMDGDLAALDTLFALAEHYDAWLVVDDAHGFGVLGPQGQGSWSHFDLAFSPRVVLMGTFGKAAGVSGAFVAADKRVTEWMLSASRTYVFTTAAPPALAVAVHKSLQIIAAGADRRTHLNSLIAHFRAGASELVAQRGWQLADSPTAIQAVIVGENATVLACSAALLAQGIWAPAIRPPTVPNGSARLRISLSAAHTLADIDALLAALASVPQEPAI